MTPDLPRIPAAIIRLTIGPEADEVLSDIAHEYAERVQSQGAARARLWVWGQALGSAPGAFRRGWQSGTTGFESEANRMRSGGGLLEQWIMDARFALRGLRARPQYVALSVLTLALGIGGTTAIFAIARTVLLEPLPYAADEELVAFWNPYDWSEAEVAYLRPDWAGFNGVAAYRPEGLFMRRDNAPPRLVTGLATSSELFDVLGTEPLIGSGFREGDDLPGSEPTVVLSYGLWQELGADRAIVGTTLLMDGAARRVLGVMPAGFWFPDPSIRAWVSTPMQPDNRSGNYALVGRLDSGREIATMADPLRRITTQLSETFTYSPQWDKTRNAELTPLREYVLGPVRPALLATLAGMGVILLMACANVATLMLGQLRGRASELAVRIALGAGRRRLAQQLLVESIVLAVIAGIAGAVAALVAFDVLLAALPLGELSAAAHTDWTLFATALVIALATALLIALAPVISLWRGDLRDALSRARSGGIGAHGGRIEDVLVVGEVALAVVLAASAAVLIRSVDNLRSLDAGVQTHNVGVVDITASGDITADARRRQIDEIVPMLEAIPGVETVAAVQRLPLRDRGDNWGIELEGRPELQPTTTAFRMVTHDYFAALGIPVRSGRAFEPTDRNGTEPVIVIDEALAAQYFPGEDPIGRRVSNGTDEFARIIGVVGNVTHAGLTDDALPGRYVLFEQLDYAPEGVTFVLRVREGASLASALQQAVRTIEQNVGSVAARDANTMESIHALAMGPTRRIMQLLSLLGGLALVLGAVGVYGVVSHFVNRRRRDWVIRMALGMRPASALGQVVGRGAALVTMGCVLGLIAAIALTRLFTSLLYDVRPADPLALAAASAALIVTGCIAALVPALRASRANPSQVLRDVA